MTLELTIKVTLILCAVALASLALRRRSAATRHLVELLGLSAALLLPAMLVALPSWEVPLYSPVGPGSLAKTDSPAIVAPAPGAPAAPSTATVDPRADRPDSAESAGVDCPCEDTLPADPERTRTTANLLAMAGGPTTPKGEATRRSFGGRIAWFPVLWALGALVVLARLGLGWLRMTRVAIDAAPARCERTLSLVRDCRRRLGIARSPRVLDSADVAVPVLWGFLQPTLLLPQSARGWSTDRLRAVLLHELAHLRRRDGLGLLIGRLAAALWWFHPLVWFVERRARRSCERACDDAVLGCGERPSSYAEHLLQIAAALPASIPARAGALAILDRGQLADRLRSILHPSRPRGLGRRTVIVALALAAVASVSLSSLRLVARDVEPVRRADPELAVSAERSVPRVARSDYLLAHDSHATEQAGERAFERAFEHHRAERWEEASAGFEEAADAGYRLSISLYNAACGYARMGQAGRAVELLERAREEGFDDEELLQEDSDLDPIRRDAEFRRLMERWGQTDDRYEAAVDTYEDLVAQRSTDGDAWYEVGSVLLQLRDFDRSIDAFEKARDHLAPRKRNALYNLACAYALSGESARALDALESAVLAGFDNEERFRNDTDLDNIRENPRFRSIEELHETLSLDRFRRSVNWGSEYSARRWEPAVEEFSELVRTHPEMGRAWFNLGWALHYSRRHAEAREAFTKQLDLGYQPAIATFDIACTYAMENDRDQALSWLERVVEDGTISAHQVAGDDDLESLRDDPRFEELVKRLAKKQHLDGDPESEGLFERWKRRIRSGISEY